MTVIFHIQIIDDIVLITDLFQMILFYALILLGNHDIVLLMSIVGQP